MKKATAVLLSAVLVLLLCACGQAKKAQPSQPDIDATLSRYKFSGVVSASQNGVVKFRRASGLADTQTKELIEPDSLFCIGSVSKQFCAAAVLLLQERGKLSVDDTLGKYYPECPYGDSITLKQMLSMRSGIAEFYETYRADGCFNEIPTGELQRTVTNENSAEENREKLQAWLFAQPLVFTPGSIYDYTNSNYFLLARLVEKLSGKAYESFIKENIFEPLGMSSSGFIDTMLGDERLAKSPHKAKTVYVGITMGLGDIISNAADIDRWLTSFEGNSLLSKESIAQMTSDYCTPDDGTSYGFGVVPESGGGFSHSGYFTSYCAFVYTNPKNRYSFFAVTNDELNMGGDIFAMCNKLIRETMKQS